MHDLVRGYAAGHARQDLGEAGIRAAIERSLDHYLHTGLVSSGIPPVRSRSRRPRRACCLSGWPTRRQLQDWARAEHQVVLQAIAQAAAAGFITRAWQIFHGQAWFLGGQGYWADFRAAAEAVLAAAEAAGDQVALGWTHRSSAGTSRSSALVTRTWPGPWITSAGPVTCPARPGRTWPPAWRTA